MAASPDSQQVFQKAISDHLEVIREISSQQELLQSIAERMSGALLEGNKILWCGNGGSAADSQHLAAELMGRFRLERRALPSIALTTDTSILTAIGNDYGYEKVFQRQVEAICTKGDVLVGISTSGMSRNVCSALETARRLGAFTVAFTGESGGSMASLAEMVLRIHSRDTARIQEGHILCGHMLCDYIELRVCSAQSSEVNSRS